MLTDYGRVPQASVYTIDLIPDGNLSDALNAAEAGTMKYYADVTVSVAGTITVVADKEGIMAQTATPPFVAGEEWWQQLISYGLSRKIDAQYLGAYRNNGTDQPAMDAQGNVYLKGQPAYIAANASGKLNWTLIAGGFAALGLVVFALKR